SEANSRVKPDLVPLGQEQASEHSGAYRGGPGSEHSRARAGCCTGQYYSSGSSPTDHAASLDVIDGLVTVMAAVDLALIVGLQLTVPAPIVDCCNQDGDRLLAPRHCHPIKDNGHLRTFLAPLCGLDRGDSPMEFSSARHDQQAIDKNRLIQDSGYGIPDLAQLRAEPRLEDNQRFGIGLNSCFARCLQSCPASWRGNGDQHQHGSYFSMHRRTSFDKLGSQSFVRILTATTATVKQWLSASRDRSGQTASLSQFRP